MSQSEDPVLSSFRSQALPLLREQFGAEMVILFGSRLQGKADEWSDLDVIIVSPGFEGTSFWKRMDSVKEALGADLRVEPFCYTPLEFQAQVAAQTIVAEAYRTGEVIEFDPQRKWHALKLFNSHYEKERGCTLDVVCCPDEQDREKKQPDFILREEPAGTEIAVEVTSFYFFSVDERKREVRWTRFWQRIQNRLAASLHGTFLAKLPPQLPESLSRQQEQKLHNDVFDAILAAASKLSRGEIVNLTHPFEFTLHKILDKGSKFLYYSTPIVFRVGEEPIAECLNVLLPRKNLQLKAARPRETFLLIVECPVAVDLSTEDDIQDLQAALELLNPDCYSQTDHIYFVDLRHHAVQELQHLW